MTDHPLPAPMEHLIACPACDALHDSRLRTSNGVLKCHRCHRRLITPSRWAGARLVALSLAALGLVVGALTLPFVSVKRYLIGRETSLLETALAFDGPLLVLSICCLVLVLILPVVRLCLILYVVAPLVLQRAPLPQARRAFRIAESLTLWSMAEVFALGAAIALIKIGELAQVTLGPAVWLFAGFVLLTMLQNTLMCRWSLWEMLDQ